MEENKARQDRQRARARYRSFTRALGFLVFVLLFFLLYGKMNTLLRNKSGMENLLTFYDEPRNSVDVIFAGTSHALNAYSPMDLWNRQGIVSYNMSQNGQMLPLTYYSIREALRLQKPKVVVVDLYYAVKNGKFGNDQFTHATVDNLRWSPVKLQAILDGTKKSLWKEMFFPTIVYHSRWTELNNKDFAMTVNPRRGSGLSYVIKEAIVPEITHTDSAGGMSEVSKEYLNRIIEFCEKKQTPLVFTVVPYSVGNDNDSKSAEEQLAIFNEAKAIAAEHGIPFLDFFDHLEELGVDFASDFYDQTHLNALGSEKVSVYMADWLAEHYDLPDHRGEDAYQRWSDDYKKYVSQKRKVKSERLPETNDMAGYFRFLENEKDYLVLLNMGGKATGGLTEREAEAMRACGIKTDLRELNGQSWVAVLDKGKNAYEETSTEKIQYHGEYEDLEVALFSYRGGSYFNTIIDGKKVGPNKAMLNVVVYSISQKKVIDSVAFDIGEDNCKAVR